MHTEAMKTCPKCQAPVPAEAPEGLCPKCLLAEVSTGTEAGQSEAPASAPPLEQVAAAFPQLDILGLIGQGGMGLVYQARQRHLERLVALKLMPQKPGADPTFGERFHREARVLARLNHPHIVAVYDFGRVEGYFYLLMEYVDGVNLRQAMRAGRFSPEQALALVPRICDALQYAHDEGILHRDIKPENLLLDTRGRIKIADFGIAKLLGERKDLTLTASGAAIGTPHYMAPEQFERPQEVDQRADIFSLGVVFYEMLTGELPLGRFAPPSEKAQVDPRVDQVVLRALEKERERRFQSAGEVKTRVENITANPIQSAAATGAPNPAAPGSTANPPARTATVSLGQEVSGNPLLTWRRRALQSGVLVGLSLAWGLFVLFVLVVGRVPPGAALVLIASVAVPASAGTYLGLSLMKNPQLAAAGGKRIRLARVAGLVWPVIVADAALLLVLMISVRNLGLHLFHTHNPGLMMLAGVFGVLGIAALDWSLIKEWSRRWRTEPAALPLNFSWLSRFPKPVRWGSGIAALILFLLLLRAAFVGAGVDVAPPAAILAEPEGYEIPAGMYPGDNGTYRSSMTVPAGYALTLTVTLWSNQMPVQPSGPNHSVFLVSSKSDSTQGHAVWRLLGNEALADGAPMEFSLGLDGAPDSESRAVQVAPPEQVTVDWVGAPSQLWPPQNAHTKYLLVKGDSTIRNDPSGDTMAPATAEWAVGVEARLDPVPERWSQSLDKPRIGAGTNWLSLLEATGSETKQGQGAEDQVGNP